MRGIDSMISIPATLERELLRRHSVRMLSFLSGTSPEYVCTDKKILHRLVEGGNVVFRRGAPQGSSARFFCAGGPHAEDTIEVFLSSPAAGLRVELPLDIAPEGEPELPYLSFALSLRATEGGEPIQADAAVVSARLLRRTPQAHGIDAVESVGKYTSFSSRFSEADLLVVFEPPSLMAVDFGEKESRLYAALDISGFSGIVTLRNGLIHRLNAEYRRTELSATLAPPNHSSPPRVGAEPFEADVSPSLAAPTSNESFVSAPTGSLPDTIGPDAASSAASNGLARRERVLIVTWSLAHNAAGRAATIAEMLHLQYDTTVVGPLFPQFGNSVWRPIQDLAIKLVTFPAHDASDILKFASFFRDEPVFDFIFVVKPRAPSILLGRLAAERSKCPIIIDIDEDELSFGLSADEPVAFSPVDLISTNSPIYGRIWTQASLHEIEAADAVTVSNVVLQRRYGGIMVRHARDEVLFDPSRFDQTAVRAQFGVAADDIVVLFLGTPREHKGLSTIADAIKELDDPRLKLYIVGMDEYSKASVPDYPFVSKVEWQPMSRVPEILSIADAVCAYQDPASATSETQIPAKITDALAMGVPVITSAVAPLEDLALMGGLFSAADSSELCTLLRSVMGSPRPPLPHLRGIFLSEFSFAVNRQRISVAMSVARARHAVTPQAFGDALLTSVVENRKQDALPEVSSSADARVMRAPLSGSPARLVVAIESSGDAWSSYRLQQFLKASAEAQGIAVSSGLLPPMTKADLEVFGAAVEEFFPDSGFATFRTKRAGACRLYSFLHRGRSRSRSFYLGHRLAPRLDYVRSLQKVRQRWEKEPIVLYADAMDALLPELVAGLSPDFVVCDVSQDVALSRQQFDLDKIRSAALLSHLVVCRCLQTQRALLHNGIECVHVADGEFMHGELQRRRARPRKKPILSVIVPYLSPSVDGWLSSLSMLDDVFALSIIVLDGQVESKSWAQRSVQAADGMFEKFIVDARYSDQILIIVDDGATCIDNLAALFSPILDRVTFASANSGIQKGSAYRVCSSPDELVSYLLSGGWVGRAQPGKQTQRVVPHWGEQLKKVLALL